MLAEIIITIIIIKKIVAIKLLGIYQHVNYNFWHADHQPLALYSKIESFILTFTQIPFWICALF